MRVDTYRSVALRRVVAAMKSASNAPVTIADARRFVAESAANTLSPTTLQRYAAVWADFERYALVARDSADVSEVDSDLVSAFVAAKRRRGVEIAANTRRTRLSALDFLFRELRRHSLADVDPCRDLDRSYERPAGPRRLEDEEIAALRQIAAAAISSDRYQRVLALAESGMDAGEIGDATWNAIDLSAGIITTEGGRAGYPRTLPLTPWGVSVLRAGFASSPRFGSDVFIAVETAQNYDSRRSSVGAVLRELLVRSGLASLPRVEPKSIVGWAGWRAFNESGRVETAAYVMGMRSLDRAALLIGLDLAEFIGIKVPACE